VVGFLFRHGPLDKDLQGFPGAAAETGKKVSVIQKIPVQDFRDKEKKFARQCKKDNRRIE